MKMRKIIAVILAVAVIACCVPFAVFGDPTQPPQTQVYETSGFTSWSAFKKNCDDIFAKISNYPKGNNPIIDANGRMVLGGSGKRNMIVEFPNYFADAEKKYPANRIQGSLVIRDFVNLYRCPMLMYSYCDYDKNCPGLNANWTGGDRSTHAVRAYNAIKFVCKVNENTGINIGYYPETFFYDISTNEVFSNGTVSGGYVQLWSDGEITNKEEKNSYLGPGDYYVKKDSTELDFDLQYVEEYSESNKKYVTKLYLEVNGKYDIYENETVGNNPHKIETKQFQNRVEVKYYKSYYNTNKTMAIASYSNSAGSYQEEYFKDITVYYDLSEYYRPTAELVDNEYKSQVDKSDKSIESLEKIRKEYLEKIDSLDENIVKFIAKQEVLDYIDKAEGTTITKKYNDLYASCEKTKTVLVDQLNQFLEEYNSYSGGVKQYIDYYTIKERLEDEIAKFKSNYEGLVEDVQIAQKMYNSITFVNKEGYEYALIEKSVIDAINENETLSDEQKSTAVRRTLDWQNNTNFDGLKTETDYYAYWRVAATENINESAAKVIVVKTNSLPGDLNHDSVFNTKDITYLCNAIVGNEVLESDFSDINRDGKVNVGDVIYLKKIYMNIPGYQF